MLIRSGLSLALLFSPLAAAQASASSWLKTGGAASIPFGHMDYCKRHASDCRHHGGVGSLAAPQIELLSAVNVRVNRSITPISDHKAHGVRDLWLASSRAGDCEEYVLAKRNTLLRAGFKPGHLRIAVGHSGGEFHAVLVVRTKAGDFVLDNKTDAVLPVNRTRMRFAKMQSATDAGAWVRITGRTGDHRRARLN